MFRAHLQVKVGHRISKRSLVTRSLSCCYDAIQISALLKNKGVEQTEMKHTGVFSVKGHSGFNWSLSRLDLVRVNPALDIKIPRTTVQSTQPQQRPGTPPLLTCQSPTQRLSMLHQWP
ncbi:uncharacterized protein ACBT44_016779 isoform 2-T2 [Syngnathus typhle]